MYKFKLTDVVLDKVDNYFISEFDFYLRSKCGCENNAAVKHLKNLGKVIRICLANRWMTYDPFSGHKNKITKVQQVILTPSDIQAIYEKDLAIERLRIVRDAFIFCCYTGMSFIDLVELKKAEIIKGEAQQLALAEAEAAAREVAKKAVQAKKEAKRLKKGKGKL